MAINGQKLVVTTKDDGADPASATASFKEMVGNGTKVIVGTLISSNVAPFGVIKARAAAMFPAPNALSSTNKTTFLPEIGLMPASGARSCVDEFPERNTYLLAADVTRSFFAGPEMYRTLFWR